MKNTKSFTITTDGAAKRISIVYDIVDDAGKVIDPNMRINRVVTDPAILATIDTIDNYAKSILEE